MLPYLRGIVILRVTCGRLAWRGCNPPVPTQLCRPWHAVVTLWMPGKHHRDTPPCHRDTRHTHATHTPHRDIHHSMAQGRTPHPTTGTHSTSCHMNTYIAPHATTRTRISYSIKQPKCPYVYKHDAEDEKQHEVDRRQPQHHLHCPWPAVSKCPHGPWWVTQRSAPSVTKGMVTTATASHAT